jgi:amino acid transporter
LQDFGSTLFGSAGGIVFALCVAASCFGALNATTFTTSRLIYVAGREHLLPTMFGELHPKRLTPVKALVLQGVLTSIMVIVGDFGGLVMFYGMVGWSWYFVTSRSTNNLTNQVTVLGVVVLRVRDPQLQRYASHDTWIDMLDPTKYLLRHL